MKGLKTEDLAYSYKYNAEWKQRVSSRQKALLGIKVDKNTIVIKISGKQH